MIVINVENVECKFSASPSDEVVEAIRLELRYENDANNPFMRKKFAKKKIEIAEFKYLYNKKTRCFPTGLLSEVIKILDSFKVEYKIADNRKDYPIVNPTELKSYVLRDYQIYAETEALIHKNCMIRIATGGGKTAIMASMSAKLNGYKIVILLRRQMLMDQTIKVFERELGFEIGQIGSGVVDIKDVTVAMVPTLARAIDPKWKFSSEEEADGEDDKTNLTEIDKEAIRKYISSCEVVIVDECHSLGSNTAQLIMNYAVTARYRTGFSASPWRDDGKDILLTAATGPRVVDINASYLIERSFLVPPYVYFFKTPTPRIPIHMQGKYQDVYREFIVENMPRNALIASKAIEAYERFEKVLILVQQVDHGELFLKYFEDNGIYAAFISGSRTAITREEFMEQFKQRSRAILIGTNGTMSEGIDLPEITVVINASGGKSSVQYYQKIGRALRLYEDKKRCTIIDFLDQNIKFMNHHANARIKIVKSEPEYKLKIQK